MMTLIRIVAGLHLAVYLGIIWYGWQNYKPLRRILYDCQPYHMIPR